VRFNQKVATQYVVLLADVSHLSRIFQSNTIDLVVYQTIAILTLENRPLPEAGLTRQKTPLEIPLAGKPAGSTLSGWLYQELRRAILEGRLPPGTQLPSTRDFADQHQISRGTVVSVFEQLEAEGFLEGRRGFGTWVKALQYNPNRSKKRDAAIVTLPSPLTGLRFGHPALPFRSHEPALTEFPIDVWARITSKILRRASSSLLGLRDSRGNPRLRAAISDYLGMARGVRCSPEQIVIVDGTQQALDILSRVLFRPGDSVWMEDPGYFGAVSAFHNAGLKCVPVAVDDEGLQVAPGKALAPRARGVYLTPGHQFPLGVVMSLERRLEVLSWAQSSGAFVLEDDYDGAYRLTGTPASSLFSLDRNESVIFIGSFNKVLCSSVRIGYMVLPERLVDSVLAFRFSLDQNSISLEQMVLAEFIESGYLGRHIRRTREIYAERQEILRDTAQKYLKGALDIVRVQTGLYTTGLLRNGMDARSAEQLAQQHGVETLAIDRFKLRAEPPNGLILGFAPFSRTAIEDGVRKLTKALTSPSNATHLKRPSR
jgi:GntR family transcriptional regulator / MocR family aminotransferase